MASQSDILRFWLDEVGEDGWYEGGAELDAEVRERFEKDWNRAMAGDCLCWLTCAKGTLAYIVLTDQFPRNMFRHTANAFASDRKARSAAKLAIGRRWDMRIEGMTRQFFYMPLMHSECLSDQDRCVRLMKERMPDGGAANLIHARAHRDIIRQFGRFPSRNEALARESTPLEIKHLNGGGYGSVLEMLRAA